MRSHGALTLTTLDEEESHESDLIRIDGAVNPSHRDTGEQPDPDATMPLMDEFGIGIRAVVTDVQTLEAVGIAHVPGPIRPDDLSRSAKGIRGACSRSFPRLPAQPPYVSSPIRCARDRTPLTVEHSQTRCA
jgi:hypothetical protein